MSEIDTVLDELAGLLIVRGAARRRLLRECRDHLEDCAAQHGPGEAVRRFGSAAEIAAAFDADSAVRRARSSAFATSAAVLAVGASTLGLVNASNSDASAVLVWAVVFFAAAQTAAVAAVLGALQAATLRRCPASASDLSLLCRRNGCALTFAGLTMVAAGGAVPGNASAFMLLVGPAVAVLASVSVLRARSLLRRLDACPTRIVRSPLEDLGELLHIRFPALDPSAFLAVGAVASAAAAFGWDRGESATVPSAAGVAIIEVALVVVGFLLLGPLLGLRPGLDRGRRSHATRAAKRGA